MASQRSLIMPHHWSELPCGVYYQRALKAQLDPWWSKITGFQLLKWGELSNDLLCQPCKLLHQVPLSFTTVQSASGVTGEFTPLPYRQHWFDACLLAHTLSYSAHPQDILREADRVLTDQGWLLISGFNPTSVLGLGKLLPVVCYQPPSGCRLLSRWRLLDWLSSLNYQILSHRTFQLVPWQASVAAQGLLEYCLPLFGCQYLIVARKQTIPLHPIQAVDYCQSLWQEKPNAVCLG
jgi:SAM-dependent methyltransferase